ncbi:MAG TPA: hypothetical protein VHE55_03570 [Fimbriimonadaceae bacterium]|nr:hypothetical protein [Fimbriimonadaceae bacterium]
MLGFLFGNYSGMYGGPIGPLYPQPYQKPPGSPSAEVLMLQQRIDGLELACAALWKLLKDTNGFTDQQLQNVIHEVDAADGVVDGKITRQGGVCPHCGNRILSRTANKCLWCGAPLDEGPFNQSGNESSPSR